jgi:hypothetical protein
MGSGVWIVVAVVCAAGAVWLAVQSVRWAKKGTQGGKMLAGALFLFPDQPPPHEQVEQQIRLEKDAESGDASRRG